MKKHFRFELCSVVNDGKVLARDLQSSPDIVDLNIPLSVLWNESSASAAYARAMHGVQADIVVFLHQDVYLPRGWFGSLARQIERLYDLDAEWAVAGVYGVTREGKHIGHVWDSGLAKICGGPFGEPTTIASVDELLLIVRRSANVTFDPALPGFHLYGTDIVLSAYKNGQSAYVLDAPVIHNSKPVRLLRNDYAAAHRFMTRKWKDWLPWPTVIVPLTRNPLRLHYGQLRARYRSIFHQEQLFGPVQDPTQKARELGFVGI